jgi:hypothetical protein
MACSPQANYTERATGACQRSWCQLLLIEAVTNSAERIPMAVNLGFLDRSLKYYLLTYLLFTVIFLSNFMLPPVFHLQLKLSSQGIVQICGRNMHALYVSIIMIPLVTRFHETVFLF